MSLTARPAGRRQARRSSAASARRPAAGAAAADVTPTATEPPARPAARSGWLRDRPGDGGGRSRASSGRRSPWCWCPPRRRSAHPSRGAPGRSLVGPHGAPWRPPRARRLRSRRHGHPRNASRRSDSGSTRAPAARRPRRRRAPNAVLPPIAVRPFVFSLPDRPPLTPNPEVADVRWVPLDHLLAPRDLSLRSARGSGRAPRGSRLPARRDRIVWGMTERILTGLLEQLRV